MKNHNLSPVKWTFPKGFHIRTPFLILGFGFLFFIFLTYDLKELLANKSYLGWIFKIIYFPFYFLLIYSLVSIWNNIRKSKSRKSQKEDGDLTYVRSFPIFENFFNVERKHSGWLLLVLPSLLLPIFVKGESHLILSWVNPKVPIVVLSLLSSQQILICLLDDYLKQIRFYLRYFYAPIISIAILVFVIVQQEQFASFFIDLLDAPRNFLWFNFLFLFSILTVWLIPSYLLFTDNIDIESLKTVRRESEDYGRLTSVGLCLLKAFPTVANSIFLWVLKVVGKPIPDDQQYLFGLAWKHKAYINHNIKGSETGAFRFFRLFLGLSYIATLASIIFGVYFKAYNLNLENWSNIGLFLVYFLPLLFIFGYKGVEKNEQGVKNLITSWLYNIWGFFLLILLVVVGAFLNKWYPIQIQFFLLFAMGIIAIISAVVLTNLVYIYPSEEDKLSKLNIGTKNETISLINLNEFKLLRKYSRGLVSVLLSLNMTGAIIAFTLFLFFLLTPFKLTFFCLEKVNAINLYLLLVNGLIAFLAIVDRYLSLRKKILMVQSSQNLDNTKIHSPFLSSSTSKVWAFLLIVFGMAYIFNKKGNDYHQVHYLSKESISDEILDSKVDLNIYAKSFIQSLDTTTSPIILVAADGGGLKAAYWTMLVLNHLDSLELDQNIFMMSGASGGAIGAGIYTYLKSQELSVKEIKEVINELGSSNFITGDFTGLFTRWPMRYLPDISPQIKNRQDRMEAMAELYFQIINKKIKSIKPTSSSLTYDSLRQLPYYSFWSDRTKHLPILITNTARAEDGVKAWIHPLKDTTKGFLTAGVIDLTTKETQVGETIKEEVISFPDALFLTNRFPIMSPAARIKGKGHFIDAGALDNSGVETIIQMLAKMRIDNNFNDFFDHPIYILGIRHDRDRLIHHKFDQIIEEKDLGKTSPRSELQSFLGAVMASGISGNPKVLDEMVSPGELGKLLNIKGLLKVNLPFRLTGADVEAYYTREIRDEETLDRIDLCLTQLEKNIHVALRKSGIDTNFIVEPALGRLISSPAQKYMKAMINFEDNQQAFQFLTNQN